MILYPTSPSIADMDARDPLRHFRDDFVLNEGEVYLDGNSLGAAPRAALAELEKAASQEWAKGQVRSWNEAGWFELPLQLGEQIGRIIGAASGQTLVGDTTSINLYKTLHAAMGLKPDRKQIIAEASSFPTDIYMAQGVISTMANARLKFLSRDGSNLQELLNDDVAVVLLNHVDYKTGFLHDMAKITAQIHAAGALVIWDLCHSVGALDIRIDEAKADFAVGCSYKYLNGGPGAPAFIYVAKHHQANARQPLSGWWGHARPFAFETDYHAAQGIQHFQCGTQPILSMRALKASLDLWDKVDLNLVRQKSLKLTDLFIKLIETHCADFDLTIATPRHHQQRGSQVALAHEHAYAIIQALIERGIIGDFRAPDTLRFGFTPLYTRFVDVERAVFALKDIMQHKLWDDGRFAQRAVVT